MNYYICFLTNEWGYVREWDRFPTRELALTWAAANRQSGEGVVILEQ